jgi:hypothetical protein
MNGRGGGGDEPEDGGRCEEAEVVALTKTRLIRKLNSPR